MAGVTFMATDPLSELVWSPHEGLSLKCADCSLYEKKPSLLWGAGPSDMVPLTTQSCLVQPPAENHADAEYMMGSRATFSSKNVVADRACMSCNENKTGNSVSKEQTSTMVQESVVHVNQEDCNVRDDKEEGACSPFNTQTPAISESTEKYWRKSQDHEVGRLNDTTFFLNHKPKSDMAQSKPLSGDSNKLTKPDSEDVCKENHRLGTEGLAPEVDPVQQYEAPEYQVLNLTSKDNGSPSFTGEESKTKLNTSVFSNAPLKKLECTAENDLVLLNSENAFAAVNDIIRLESTREVKNCSQLDEEALPDRTVQIKHSQFKSLQGYKRKYKGKALSDAGVNERMSKEENDSHESVESCNSAGSSVTGKKQRIFEQQVDSKRVKKQVEDSRPSTSFVRQDSSFMNWISNILKGLSKLDQDGTSSLALTLAHPNYAEETQEQKLIMCVKDQDSECKMGFRAFFQSLYCPNTRANNARALNVQYQMEEGSEKLVLANAINSIPGASPGENGKFNRLKSGDGGAGPSTQPSKSSTTFRVIQENGNTNCGNFFNLACGTERDKVSSLNSSLGTYKAKSTENKHLDSALKEKKKTISNVGYESVHHESLWISRFASKNSISVLNVDHFSHRTRTGGFHESAAGCTRFLPYIHNHHIDSSKDHKKFEIQEECFSKDLQNDVVGKESVKRAANTKSSSSLKRIKRHDNGKFIDKVKPNLTFKSSEAMASVFARRLDALKHTIQSNGTNGPTRTAGICFFCGQRGHDLQDCSEITECELEDLLRNIHADSWPEELPSLCIRCFQLNHWAIACPNASSRRHCRAEYDASLVDKCSLGKARLTTEKESIPKLLESKERLQVCGANIFCSSPRMDARFTLNKKMTGLMSSDKVLSTLDNGKCVASSSGKTTTLCNYVNRQISDVPLLTFDAIKKLRLSRTDILKWTNSHASLLPLDGFFLRLRFGKWEEGSGGTGYYVACISGTGAVQRNRATQSAGEDSIFVNVGDMQCSVESQYISNHDFLEAWVKSLRQQLKFRKHKSQSPQLGMLPAGESGFDGVGSVEEKGKEKILVYSI